MISHWMQGIGLLLVLSSMIFLIIIQFKRKKRDDISYRIKYGEICYRCKSDINIDSETAWRNLIEDKPNKSLCESCKREDSLNTILNRGKLYIDFSDKKMNRIAIIFGIASMILNISGMWYKSIGFFGGICLFIDLWISYKYFMATSRKKVQSK